MESPAVKPIYHWRSGFELLVKEWRLVDNPHIIHNENGPAREGPGIKQWWLNNRWVATGDCPSNWNDLVTLAHIEQFMVE